MTGHKLIVAATAIACVGAAGVGSYLAVRMGSTTSSASPGLSAELAPTQALPAPAAPADPSRSSPQGPNSARDARPASNPAAAPASAAPAQAPSPTMPEIAPPAADAPVPAERPAVAVLEPAAVAESQPVIEEFEVPADAVVGIQLDTNVSSETSAVEDRVAGRVTRAVAVGNRTVIPAGALLSGYVTTVERGGKVRERARIGIKFTSVTINKVRTPIQTETIYRVGDSPSREATTKIGGGAAIGTIIGGMLGGKKGAAIGATAGAAGGTAVVMKGDSNAATFAAGTSLTVRLASPVKVRVE